MRREDGSRKALVAIGAVAVAFNVVFLMVPFAHTGAFWCAYAFTWVAVIACAVANTYVISASRTATSGLYRTSVVNAGIAYLVVALVLNLGVAALLPWAPVWLVVVPNVLVLALFVLRFLAGSTGAELVEADEARTAAQTEAITGLTERARLALAASSPGAPFRRELEALVEDLRYADPVSNEYSQPYEAQLGAALGQVASLIDAGRDEDVLVSCRNARAILRQRNIACRKGK